MADVNGELYKDLLPPGAIPTMGLRIVSYIDKQGEMRFNYRPDGEVLITQFIGTLYWIMQDITEKGKNLNEE